MANIIGTLHPEDNQTDNFYPNIQTDNIPNEAINTSKVVEGLFLGKGGANESGVCSSLTAPYDNLNTFPQNKTMTYILCNPANSPFTNIDVSVYCIIVVSIAAGTSRGKNIQMAYRCHINDNTIYEIKYRIEKIDTNHSFSDWLTIYDSDIKNAILLPNFGSKRELDLDLVPQGAQISYRSIDTVLHGPEDLPSGYYNLVYTRQGSSGNYVTNIDTLYWISSDRTVFYVYMRVFEQDASETYNHKWIKIYDIDGDISIPSNSITTDKLANGAVTTDKLSDEIKSAIKPKLPVITFSRDQFNDDGYVEILKQYGFTASVSQPESANIALLGINNSEDFSLYTTDLANSSTYNDIVNKVNEVAENSLIPYGQNFPYTAMFCNGHAAYQDTEQAAKDLGFRYVRAVGIKNSSGAWIQHFSIQNNNPDYMFVSPYLMDSDERTSAVINNYIDDWVNNSDPTKKYQLCLFCHTIADEYESQYHMTVQKFTEVVQHVKQLVDEGKCIVLNFREYYEYYHPVKASTDEHTRISNSLFNLHTKRG